jgi:hypothetical protein
VTEREELTSKVRESKGREEMTITDEMVEAANEADYGVAWFRLPRWLKERRRKAMRDALEAAFALSRRRSFENQCADFQQTIQR